MVAVRAIVSDDPCRSRCSPGARSTNSPQPPSFCAAALGQGGLHRGRRLLAHRRDEMALAVERHRHAAVAEGFCTGFGCTPRPRSSVAAVWRRSWYHVGESTKTSPVLYKILKRNFQEGAFYELRPGLRRGV